MALFNNKIWSTLATHRLFQLMHWVWQDAIQPLQRKIYGIISLQILSVVASFGGFGLLYYYVDLIDKSMVFTLGNYTADPRSSQALLIFVSLLVGFIFLLSACLDYFSNKRLIQLNQTFEEASITRLYQAVMAKKHLLPYQNQAVLSAYNIKKALIKDCKFYGRALFSIVQSVIPLAKLGLSLFFMFYLATFFSLLVVIILLGGGILVLRISKSIVRETQRKEDHIKFYTQEIAQALAAEQLEPKLLEKNGAKNYLSAFYARLLYTQQNQFVIKLLVAVITTVLLLVIGHLTLFGNASWALLVGYLLALRFFLNSLQGINGILKQLSTFYDYIRNYYAILNALANLNEWDTSSTASSIQSPSNDYFQFQPDDDGDDLVDDF